MLDIRMPGMGGLELQEQLDILVNNVGIAHMDKFVDLSLSDIDAILHTNVRATLLASQAAIPHLVEIAAVAAVLASPAVSYMTGSVVTVDGGLNA